MSNEDKPGKRQPFAALIAASSLLAAILYVAGFSFRWSYYYNFGVQHLVFNLSFQSILTASMEMIRLPRNLLITLASLTASLVLLNLFILGVQSISMLSPTSPLRKTIAVGARMLGFHNQLVTDSIRAVGLFYLIYMLSSQMGYMKFKEDSVNSDQNTLPAVAAVVQGDEKQDMALACEKGTKTLPSLIGNAKLVREMQANDRTCTSDDTKWRLLYRDEKSIYLFASRPQIEGRPLTIVLPNTDKTVLVME